MYQIIDNVLSKKSFLKIQNYFLNQLTWKYSDFITGSDYEKNNLDCYMFNNIFYINEPFFMSKDISILLPIIDELDMYKFYRCKSNFYSRTNEIVQHSYHKDRNDEHLVALYYVNSNNGFTVLKDVAKIESIENRLLIFDGKLEHASTSSSDNVRINVAFNFVQTQRNNTPSEKKLENFNYD